MTTKIERTAETHQIELEKRTYLPFKITSNCPNCGLEHVTDLARREYLSYPVIGMPCKLYHCCKGCETEWKTMVVVNVTLELALDG